MSDIDDDLEVVASKLKKWTDDKLKSTMSPEEYEKYERNRKINIENDFYNRWRRSVEKSLLFRFIDMILQQKRPVAAFELLYDSGYSGLAVFSLVLVFSPGIFLAPYFGIKSISGLKKQENKDGLKCAYFAVAVPSLLLAIAFFSMVIESLK